MQRPWGGVRAWNKMISVTGLKDVSVCGDGVRARDELEDIGIEIDQAAFDMPRWKGRSLF